MNAGHALREHGRRPVRRRDRRPEGWTCPPSSRAEVSRRAGRSRSLAGGISGQGTQLMPRIALKVSLLAAAAFAAGVSVGPVQQVVAQAGSADSFRQLKLFGDVYERVRAEYVEEVGEQKLFEAAINGMLTSLDPHSSYLDTERYRDMQVQTRGECGGLGIEVTMENGLVKVVSPIDDTPASKAGIAPGDLITHIDGEAVMGMALSEAVERMRGPVDSKIDLRLLRKGKEEPFEVSLNRAIIKISPVRARVEGGDVG